MKSPIFLFSLPRSGSTLLQRVLMAHNDIASVAEPWIMLPFSYANNKEGVLTEYSHETSTDAVGDFIKNLPNREDDYYEALGAFAQTLYEKQCSNKEKYFLDKTPRYYYIIPQILKAFPNAKFIFLFRNPKHVMSSIIQTWSNGRFNKIYRYERDLTYGPKALSEGYELLKNIAYSVQYEKYISNPEKYTKEICNYLEIEFDKNMLSYFTFQNTKGSMGDPTGVKEYKSINTAPLDKWKKTFNSTYRKKYITNYIKDIDDKVLEIQGYNKINILKNIEELKVSNKMLIQDRFDVFYSKIVCILKPNIWFAEPISWAKKTYIS